MNNILQRSWNQLISGNTNSGLQQSSEQSSLRYSNPMSSKGTGAFGLSFNNSTSNNGVGKFGLRFNNPGVGSTSGSSNSPSNILGSLGDIDTTGVMNMAQGAIDIIGGGINDFQISDYNPIQYGQYNSLESLNANAGNTQQLNLEANNVAGGAVSGALSGASAGAMFGLPGMAIGGVVGGVTRLLTGLFGNNKKKEEEEKRYKEAFGGLMAQSQNITTSEINRNIWNDFKNGGLINNRFESGGQMSNGGVFSNNVNIVNSGGTHEENKYGGIPVSVDQEGKPNLIEEGEVVWNDYVFSNSLNLEEDLRKGANLPKEYTGKSFAKIAEDIQKESEERPYNPISRRGLEDGLGKLIIAQELEKLRQDEDSLLQLMGEDANVFETGGDMNRSTPRTIFNTSFNPQHYSNKFQGMKQQSTKASAEESANSAIDDFIALLDAELPEDDPIKELYLSYIEAGIDNVDMVKMLVGQDILESGGKPYNNNWGNITAGSNYKGKKVKRGDKDAEGNPIQQDFRAYDSTKDYVKDKVSLLKRLYDFNKNDSPEVFAGKLTGNNKGGYKYATDPEYANKLARMWGGDKSVRSNSYIGQSASPSENTSGTVYLNNRPFSPERITGISGLPPTIPRYNTNNLSTATSVQRERESPEKIEPLGFTNLLSMAPIIGNMAGYAESMSQEPEITQFDRVSPTPVQERLNYTPVNSAYASDILQNQYSGIRRNILDSTGGNRGVAQTALLTNDRNMAESLYQSAYQGDQLNFARNAQVQGFNAEVSQFNSQQDLQSQMINSRINMEEVIANEQNRAALDNDRQIRRNAVLENLGGLAQQLRWERLAPIISGGYDQYGRKVK